MKLCQANLCFLEYFSRNIDSDSLWGFDTKLELLVRFTHHLVRLYAIVSNRLIRRS